MDLSFRQNVGTVERIIRVIAGTFFILLALYYPFTATWPKWLLGLIGLSQVIEGAIGY
ncbi:YgaP family membrane protein [Heliorestis convoluta]|uniref:Inner membrane protein YgaP-like transmembrane domain-containing protein n=1 Tax=Heliorestis convoluta TaxID=356322 RepID=A0A5Q2MWB9_9FIRM|nr:DUF2892 domain-containing protein [Heliorestis convoluta]QGG46734.1 hypothetical protein FTV88_0555 [Heliorestis convoluta]